MARVLVALAATGGIPVKSRAGKERSDPPPAMALTTPAPKAARASRPHGCWCMGRHPNPRTGRGRGRTAVAVEFGPGGHMKIGTWDRGEIIHWAGSHEISPALRDDGAPAL